MTDQELLQMFPSYKSVSEYLIEHPDLRIPSDIEMRLDALWDHKKVAKEFAFDESMIKQLKCKLARVTAERDAAIGEIERLKSIMREHGIMVIPSKYPGGRSAWNIRRGAQEEA